MENIQCNFVGIPKYCFSTPLFVCLIRVYILKDVVDDMYLAHYILCMTIYFLDYFSRNFMMM